MGDAPARSTSDTDATASVDPATTESDMSPPGEDRVVTPTSVAGGGEASVGGVPDHLVAPLVDEVATRESVAPDSVEIVRAQQVVWSDSSLGCPGPGYSYLPVLTDGYWVVLRAGAAEYDFRAHLDGEFRRCVGGAPPYDGVVDR